MAERSIVEYFGLQESNHCGYCKTETPDKFSHGMWAHYMTVRDYQDLIDRGWRRSGKYVYKPVMDRTCCPQYAIRCDAGSFKPTKSHKKVLKQFNAYLETGKAPRTSRSPESCLKTESNETEKSPIPPSSFSQTESSSAPSDKGTKAVRDRSNKAKEKRKKRKIERMVKRGEITAEEAVNYTFPKRFSKPKDLEDYLEKEPKPGAAHKFTCRLLRSEPAEEDFDSSFAESYRVYWKYQTEIHGDPPDKPTEAQFRRFLSTSPLSCRLLPVEDTTFRSSLPESAALFSKYQMTVHKDEPSDCGFNEFSGFLVETPLIAVESDAEGHPGFGSFHEQYLLDGKIIAVGVLDILPNCISSKYFYYDPSFHFLSLGTFSALREIWLTRKFRKLTPSLRYYYMGFYVHNCPKMKYKAKYSSSFLLCPETYSWVHADKAVAKLNTSKYARFSEDLDEVEKDHLSTPDPVLILHKRQAMPFHIFQLVKKEAKFKDGGDEFNSLKEYASLVGKTCASRILLYRE